MQKSVHVQRQGSVEYHPVPEIQKDTAIRQGVVQGERSVRPEQAVIRPFSQMATGPDRFQRTTTKREVAMDSASGGCMKTASIRQEDIPVTKREYHDKPESSFQRRVNSEIARLNKIDKNRDDFDAVLYCIGVARSAYNLLHVTRIGKKRISKPGNMSFLIAKMTPIYNAAFQDALKKAQQDIAAGDNSRGFAKKLEKITKLVDILLEDSPDYQNYKTTLCTLFRHCIDNEFIYLQSLALETSPSAYAAHASANAIEFLLRNHSIIRRISLMSEDEIKIILERKDELFRNIFMGVGNGTTEREKEKRDTVKEDTSPEIADMLAKMKLFDKLQEQFDEIIGKGFPEDVQQCACILKKLAEICNCYDQSGIKVFGFPVEMKRFLSIVAKRILLPMTCDVGNDPSLKESLELIGCLMKSKHDWLGHTCKITYMRCTQSKSGLTLPAAETGNMTDHYDDDKTCGVISKLMMNDTEADLLNAARLLSQIMARK